MILGVYIGQEYNFPNIRNTYFFLSDKINQYRSTPQINNNDNTWIELLNKIRQNLKI